MGKKVNKSSQSIKQTKIKKQPRKPKRVKQASKSIPSSVQNIKNQKTLFKLKDTIKSQSKVKNETNNESKVKTVVSKKSNLLDPAQKNDNQKRQGKRGNKNKNDEAMICLRVSQKKQSFSINFNKEDKKQIKKTKKEQKKLQKQTIHIKNKAKPKQKSQNQTKRSTNERQQETNVCPSKDINAFTKIQSIIEKGKCQKSEKQKSEKIKENNFKISASKQKEQEKCSKSLKVSLTKEKKRKPGRPRKLLIGGLKKRDNCLGQREQSLEKLAQTKVATNSFGPKCEKQKVQTVKNEQSISINESIISQIPKPAIVHKLHSNENNKLDRKYKIVVEGISTNSFEGDIRDLFSDCGPIMKVKVTNKKKNKYATVQFEKKDCVQRALAKNGIVYMSKILTISQLNGSINDSFNKGQRCLKQEQQDDEQDSKNLIEMLSGLKKEEEYEKQMNKNNSELQIVYVSSPHLIIEGFSQEISLKQIRDLFSKYGNVVSCQINQVNHAKNQIDKIVFVHLQYETASMAEKAKQILNNEKVYGKIIKVETNMDSNNLKETDKLREKKKSGNLKQLLRGEKC